MDSSIYLILLGLTLTNAKPATEEASFLIKNEHDLQRLLKTLYSQGKFDIAFSHHEDGPKTHHEDRARFIRHEDKPYRLYHGDVKSTHGHKNRHSSIKHAKHENYPSLTNIQTLNLLFKKRADDKETKSESSSNDDSDIEKLLGLAKRSVSRNGNSNAEEVLALLKDLGETLDNNNIESQCKGDKCGRNDDRDDDDSKENRYNLRCNSNKCNGNDDRAACVDGKCEKDRDDDDDDDTKKSSDLRCNGNGCAKDRDDDDDDDDDDDADISNKNNRCNGNNCGRADEDRNDCNGDRCGKGRDDYSNNNLRCYGDNCGRADCAGDQCGRDRDDDDDDDDDDDRDNYGSNLRCIGDNCGRADDDRADCDGDRCGRDRDDNGIQILRCSGDSCGISRIDRSDLRERRPSNKKISSPRTKKIKINDELDAIVVDMSHMGKTRLKKQQFRNRDDDHHKVLKLIENVDLDNLLEGKSANDILNRKDLLDSDDKELNAVVIDISKGQKDLSSEISSLVTKLQAPFSKYPSQISSIIKKQSNPHTIGRGNSKILSHNEQNNNVYVPQWLLNEVISKIPLKHSVEEAETTINDALPLTPKQKIKLRKAIEKQLKVMNTFRRSDEQDIGVPFHLEIQGLGQVNP